MAHFKTKVITKHRTQRAMKVPVVDKHGILKATLLEHKKAVNDALKAHRPSIMHIADIENAESRTQFMKDINTAIYGDANDNLTLLSKTAYNKTARNSINEPVKEFKNRKGNNKRPPRFRRNSVRYDAATSRVNTSIGTLSLAFRREVEGSYLIKKTFFKDFNLSISERYLKKFRGMEHTFTYLHLKEGRIWASLVFAKDTMCDTPTNFIGIDAGMYKNENAFYPYANSLTLKEVSAKVSPMDAAEYLTNAAKDSSSAIVIESLKSLTRRTSGNRGALPISKYFKALEVACQDKSITFIEIDPSFTSMIHAGCGAKIIREKKPGEWSKGYCPECDEHFHADKNAAINIAIRGRNVYKEITDG